MGTIHGMGSPFPGMDPYLEHPALWRDVHNSLIAALRDQLAPLLRPNYVVRIEERTYVADPDLVLVGVPDVTVSARPGTGQPGLREPHADAAERVDPAASVTGVAVEVPLPTVVRGSERERASRAQPKFVSATASRPAGPASARGRRTTPTVVRETWLEVRLPPGGQVVTTIELLSPTNKLPGEGRRQYESKRNLVLGSPTSLVEIDLVRAGEPMLLRGVTRRGSYSVLVSRGDRRPHATLFPFGLPDPIPTFPIPLRPGEPEPEVRLRELLDHLYERASYDLTIDYTTAPVPPLDEPDRAWAEQLLAASGRRPR